MDRHGSVRATMQAAWEKLGYTPETAQPIIASRFDYVFDPIMMAVTAVVVVFYYVLRHQVFEQGIP